MKRILKLLTVTIILTIFLSACGQGNKENKDQSDQTNSQEEATILNIAATTGDAGYLTPYAHHPRQGAHRTKLIFDSMLERGEEGLIPWLAKSWDIDESGTDYTFYINEGVKWQDGKPMTAEDIKFSFEYYKVHPPVSDDLALGQNDYIKEINVIDDHTINIKVESPDASLLYKFGSARIIPKHIWEDVDDPTKFDAPEAIIGCGPYKLTQYNREQGAYELEAFEDYWGYKPAVDKIRFIPVSDPILAFENGEIDRVDLTPDILSKYQDDPEYKVIEKPGFWGYRILLNMENRPELKEKNLRQAIAHGIDKDELIEKVARGAAKPGSAGYLPIDHTFYNGGVKEYDFDIEKTKSLLDGEEYEISLLIGDSNEEVRIAELLKLNLEKAGIILNITSLDSKSRDAAVRSEDYEMVLYGHGGWGRDPDELRKQYTENNIPGYMNKEIERLAEEQLRAIDGDQRQDIVFQLQEAIAEEIPMIPLYNTTGHTAYRPEKYDGWKHIYDHHNIEHNKISYLEMK